RLQNGESLEACLQAYPEHADDLRDLLGMRDIVAQAKPDASERIAMRGRLDAQISTLIDNTDFDAPTPFQWWSPLNLLVATVVLAFVSILLINAQTEMFASNTATPLATNTTQAMQTATMTVSSTPTVESTQEEQATAIPTQTIAVSSTPTTESIPEEQATATPTLLSEASTALPCTLPAGWVVYRIQTGDNLSALANNTGTTVAQLTEVNCIDNPRLLSVGDELFVPRPVTITPQTNTNTNTESGSASDNTNSQPSVGGGNSNTDSDSDDNDFDDNDDDDDDDDYDDYDE
ncbi:MAG: LysM peptidoglycan-binding domain-containing protein, partial [Chloroflexota bacterium]